MWDRVRREVEFELSQLRKLMSEHASLLREVGSGEPDTAHRLALGATINSFYGGIESIFRRIAQEIDHKLPTGESWHRDLLMAVAQATGDRPSVISAELLETLRDYLGFRHVFRKGYAFDLKWPRMAHLALACQPTLDRLTTELQSFFGGTR